MPEVEADQPIDAAGDLPLIREAAREAGQIAMRFFRRNPEVWMKGGQSPVSEADYAVDKFLHRILREARPTYGWLSEETVDSPERLCTTRTFVVDPIDGTRAFLEGSNTWCISIAVVEDGNPLVGVLECPAKMEFYEAATGKGATKNGEPIHVSSPDESFVVAGPKQLINSAPHGLRSRFKTMPYIPSLAYRLAMVASGALDATFVKPNSHDWDLAAADRILREAGGQVVDHLGKPLRYAGPNPRHGTLAAGSGSLLAELVAMLGAYQS